MIEIAEKDRAYFAGLLDGEGSIVIHKGVNKNNNSLSYKLTVSFGLTYKKILLEMQKIFGGNIYTKNMEKRMNTNSARILVEVGAASPSKWKEMYSYELNGREALYFLKIVEPFCREKKDQAALGIRYEQGRRPNACSHGRSERETERCEFFYQELKRLKHEQPDEDNIETDFEDDQQSLFSFEAEP